MAFNPGALTTATVSTGVICSESPDSLISSSTTSLPTGSFWDNGMESGRFAGTFFGWWRWWRTGFLGVAEKMLNDDNNIKIIMLHIVFVIFPPIAIFCRTSL
jgi:hypothetical protein